MTLNPCVYCGAPWLLESIEIDHRPDCASVTGLYPVRAIDVKHRMCCMTCGDPFSLIDSYVLRRIFDHISEVVCLTCAAFDREDA